MVKSNDTVLFQHSNAAPWKFIDALMRRKDELHRVQISHTRIEGSLPYFRDDYGDTFFHNTFMISPEGRKPMDEGRADYIPCCFVNQPGLVRRKNFPVDTCVLHVSPPDAYGYCSYGICASYVPGALESIKTVIAEINPQMPKTCGAQIHISDIDYFIEVDYPLPESKLVTSGPVEIKIGEHVASLIDDGCTLQTGIGGIPNALMGCLSNHKDIGIHTEMYADGVVELVKKGVITGRKRGYHAGKITSTFVMGTKTTFDFVNNNPSVEIVRVEETNDPSIIALNNKFVGINAATEVDVTGQICAESVGTRHVSGTGGQLDFALGAHICEGGKFIIALPSTAADGKASRISACLAEGAGVTTPRSLADYIVTEYGIASLRGKNLAQRAKAMLQIAHPDFQEELERKVHARRDVHFTFFK